MHEVIRNFKDKNNGNIYMIGDKFPHKGRKPKQERLDELIELGYIKFIEKQD